MEILQISPTTLNPVDSTEAIQSFSTVVDFTSCDTFSLEVPATKTNKAMFEEDQYIYCPEDGGFFGIIRSIKKKTENKQNMISITGTGGEGPLFHRIYWGRLNYSSVTYETLMRKYINDCLTAPGIADRKPYGWTLAAAFGYSETTAYEKSFANALEQIESLSEESGIGFGAKYIQATHAVQLWLRKGTNRTQDQSTNKRATFSRDRRNIQSLEYTKTVENYANCFLIAGAGEGDARITTELIDSSASGVKRKEMFVDARDLTKADNITDAQYLEQLQQRGRSKRAECEKTESMDGDYILTNGMPNYLQIGDLVTVYDDFWGLTMNTQFKKLTREYATGAATKTTCTFGSGIPSLLKKIKRL